MSRVKKSSRRRENSGSYTGWILRFVLLGAAMASAARAGSLQSETALTTSLDLATTTAPVDIFTTDAVLPAPVPSSSADADFAMQLQEWRAYLEMFQVNGTTVMGDLYSVDSKEAFVRGDYLKAHGQAELALNYYFLAVQRDGFGSRHFDAFGDERLRLEKFITEALLQQNYDIILSYAEYSKWSTPATVGFVSEAAKILRNNNQEAFVAQFLEAAGVRPVQPDEGAGFGDWNRYVHEVSIYGSNAEIVSAYEHALRLFHSDTQWINYHLAEAYNAIGEHEKAKAQFVKTAAVVSNAFYNNVSYDELTHLPFFVAINLKNYGETALALEQYFIAAVLEGNSYSYGYEQERPLNSFLAQAIAQNNDAIILSYAGYFDDPRFYANWLSHNISKEQLALDVVRVLNENNKHELAQQFVKKLGKSLSEQIITTPSIVDITTAAAKMTSHAVTTVLPVFTTMQNASLMNSPGDIFSNETSRRIAVAIGILSVVGCCCTLALFCGSAEIEKEENRQIQRKNRAYAMQNQKRFDAAMDTWGINAGIYNLYCALRRACKGDEDDAKKACGELLTLIQQNLMQGADQKARIAASAQAIVDRYATGCREVFAIRRDPVMKEFNLILAASSISEINGYTQSTYQPFVVFGPHGFVDVNSYATLFSTYLEQKKVSPDVDPNEAIALAALAQVNLDVSDDGHDPDFGDVQLDIIPAGARRGGAAPANVVTTTTTTTTLDAYHTPRRSRSSSTDSFQTAVYSGRSSSDSDNMALIL